MATRVGCPERPRSFSTECKAELLISTEPCELSERSSGIKELLQIMNLWRRGDVMKNSFSLANSQQISRDLLGVDKSSFTVTKILFKEPSDRYTGGIKTEIIGL